MGPSRGRWWIALAAAGAVAGCASPRPRIDVCGRGDRADLAAALRGGALELAFLDRDGAVLAEIDAAVDRLTDLARSVPDGTASVEVTGRAAGGEAVAIGRAEVDDGGACVCLALTAQHAAACEAIGCRIDGDACTFVDADGQPVGVRALSFGDAPGDTFAGAVRETYLSSADGQRDATFGGEPLVRITGEPQAIGLVHVDVTALPRSSEIVSAVLELTPCAGECAASGTLAAFPVLEAWEEGAAADARCATWNCRRDELPWTVAGCGYLSDVDRSRQAGAAATAAIEGPGAPVRLDVTVEVAAWVADPATNLGLALAVDELGAVELVASEGEAPLGARPRLVVELRLIDEVGGPDAGPDAPPDASPDVGSLPEMVTVAAGGFIMGCDPNVIDTCEDDEQPPHFVSLAAFEIDTTEVTQEAYAACVADGTCPEPPCDWAPATRGRYPVTCVTHGQAAAYCAFVGKRLPTEAEWEKAARGTGGGRWPWGDATPTCTLANSFGCVGTTQPVGIRPDGASPYGARDMAGNTSEWVADFYGAGYYAVSPDAEPTGPATGSTRVRRGGAHGGTHDALEVFNRGSAGPNQTRNYIGIRCARSL